VNVHVSAFSLKNIFQIESAYLGAYPNGLGVTDRGEGNGSNGRERVDNISTRHNMVLLEFSSKVIPDRIYLDDVGSDSDILIIIGTANDPYNRHLVLNNGMLTGADIDNGGGSSRWANINPANRAGNWMLIMPRLLQSNDEFKIRKLEFKCARATSASLIDSFGPGSPALNAGNSLTQRDVYPWSFMRVARREDFLSNFESLPSSGTFGPSDQRDITLKFHISHTIWFPPPRSSA
jgi:hypothetical protein